VNFPPIHSLAELAELRQAAIANFRAERLEEPLEDYLDAFDEYLGVTEDLLETSVDLTELEERALEIVTNKALLKALRYIAAPPISDDDLRTLAEVKSLAPGALKKNPVAIREIVRTVMVAIDRKRFTWDFTKGTEPDEHERSAAVLATAALLASAHVATKRRHAAQRGQEGKVSDALIAAGFKKVKRRKINKIADAPGPGEFCPESEVMGRKGDFIVGLFDGRILILECKASNSELNSLKRLSNDTVAKAQGWRESLGRAHVVAAAMISGVYKLERLAQVQGDDLYLFWSHRLDDFVAWVESTRAPDMKAVAEQKKGPPKDYPPGKP